MESLEPVDLQESVSYLSFRNCSATAIKVLGIHPSHGLFAQLNRGDTSFEFRLPPLDFCSFNMAELPICSTEGNERFYVGILHLELTEKAAASLKSQLIESLTIRNLPESFIVNDRCTLSSGAVKVRPHHAVVIGLDSSLPGKQTFHSVMQLFQIANNLAVPDIDAYNAAFSPRLLAAGEMESVLIGCNEFESVNNAFRLQQLCKISSGPCKILSVQSSIPKAALTRTPVSVQPVISVDASMDEKTSVAQQPEILDEEEAKNDDSIGDTELPLLDKPVPVYQRDLDCLKPGFYVNDTIVDFYVKYLVEKFESGDGNHKAYAFSSHFYSMLTRNVAHTAKNPAYQSLTPGEKRFENVRNWVRKLHHLFSTEYIFIPVNINQHWLLLVVQHVGQALKNRKKSEDENLCPAVIVFDSMSSAFPIANAHYHVARYIKQFLECYAKSRNLELDTTLLKDIRPRVPQQNNATDCALYVCQYAESFLENPPSFCRDTGPKLSLSPAEPETSSQQASPASQSSAIKRSNNSVVVLVRDLDAVSTRRIVSAVKPPPSPSSAQKSMVRSTMSRWEPVTSLAKWFPVELVANKRQEILKLLRSLIDKSSKVQPAS